MQTQGIFWMLQQELRIDGPRGGILVRHISNIMQQTACSRQHTAYSMHCRNVMWLAEYNICYTNVS